MRLEHEIEILDLHVDKWRRPVGAGIVDQDVERRLRSDGFLHRLDVAHVERERVRLLPARADRLRALPRSPLRARGERDMRAGVGQRGGRGQAEPRPAPVTSARLPSRRKEGVGVRSTILALPECTLLTLPWRGRVGGEAAGVG